MAEASDEGSFVLFLGCGSSTGVPSPACIIRPFSPPCTVCASAVAGPAEECANYRNNPSLLIRKTNPDGSRVHVQIDCGKTFREAMLRWYPKYGIRRLDALVLSHDHADAILGLDDVRGMQGGGSKADPERHTGPLPVYLTSECFVGVSGRFPYLMPTARENQTVRRHVAQIDWRQLESDRSPFEAAGIRFQPFPVWHGADYISLGFIFGETDKTAYISDVSEVPEDGYELLEREGPIELLIIDCLFQETVHETHFNLPDTVRAIRRIRPRRAFLTGMTHEFDYARDNQKLAEMFEGDGIDVKLARDGLAVRLRL